MTSTNDGKDVKSNQTSGPKGKSYYIELYKLLEAGLSGDCELSERTHHLCEAWRRIRSLCQHSAPTTHPHLLSWLQRHTARTVLQTEWQSPKSKDEQKRLGEAIDAFIKECENHSGPSREAGPPQWELLLVARGEWFKRILSNPWGHPVLRVLLDPRGEPPSDQEVLEWLKDERGVMFVTRLRQLAAAKCDDLALSLASAVMDRVRACATPPSDHDNPEHAAQEKTKEDTKPTFEDILKAEAGFTVDVWELLTDIEFVLLHKGDKRSRCIELAKQTPLRNGYQLVERLQSRLETSPREKKLWKNAKEVATLIAQVVIARCMVVAVCGGVSRTALYCCARSLVRALGARLPQAARALAAPAATARHLHTLAAAVDAQSTEDLKPFVCELYVRAITAGMNELERLKLKTEKESEARSSEQTLASWFTQLGGLLSASERLRCECTLTAFSVHPSPAMFDRIKLAPPLPPVALDLHEPKQESTSSEFGSWANDSRSQTNFVKTSETLNLKHTQHRANVLSTAIFSEGEALGLSPELCQDIAVLLSGPRLKTLSWDTNRELLLENCRTYMERTNFGTRALTTELKYLNLDPRQFEHLPLEEDDETDMYYGIEKGYEHMVEEYQEPEEIWQDAEDPERTDSATESESGIVTTAVRLKKTKKKTQKLLSSDDDCDPLSLVAEAKRKEKKKERPHSKERSKEHKKKPKSKPKDPLEVKEHSSERKKEPKKKEKRERKKKQPADVKPSSLSSLIGMKVVNAKKPVQDPEVKIPFVSDSDYDSQEKISLNSLASEGNDNDVLFDGLFSMDEMKSPDKAGPVKNNEPVPNGTVAVSSPAVPYKDNKSQEVSNRVSTVSNANTNQISSPVPEYKLDQGKLTTVTEEVKKSISKLIQFRRQKTLSETEQKNPVQPNIQTSNIQSSVIKTLEPQIPTPSQCSPQPNVVQSPKVFINQSQSNQLAELRSEVNSLLHAKAFGIARPVIQFSPKSKNPLHNNALSSCIRFPNPQGVDKPMQDMYKGPYAPKSTIQGSESKLSTPHTSVTNKQQQDKTKKNFDVFLKELHESINAGAVMDPKEYRPIKKEIKPIHRVTPIVPTVEAEPKTSPCAKQTKKTDNSLNTFSRLNYLHKNKILDLKSKQVVDAIIDNQSKAIQNHQNAVAELSRIMSEPKMTKSTLSKTETVISRADKSSFQDNIQSVRKIEKPHCVTPARENLVNTNVIQPSSSMTQIKTENQCKTSPIEKSRDSLQMSNKISLLTDRDQQELLHLLRQKNKQNLNHPKIKVENVKEHMQPSQTVTGTSNYSCSSHLNKNRMLDDSNNVYSNMNVKQMTKPSPSVKPSNLNQIRLQNKPINIIKTEEIPAKTTDQKVQKIEIFSDVEPKSHKPKSSASKSNARKKSTDWKKVMDAILSHKTPSRGPKALDMALNKDAYDNSLLETLQHPRIVRSNFTVTDPSKPAANAVPVTHSCNILRRSNTESVIKSNKNKATSKETIKATLNPSHTTTVLQSNLNVAKQAETLKRHIPTEKRQSHIVKEQVDVLKKPNRHQQFTCPLPKEDDPFISGIRNSDYDLLEELMDDDLRQEIGELSSDDDNYGTPIHCLKNPKGYPMNKLSTQNIQEEKRCLNSALINTPIQKKPVPKMSCDAIKASFDHTEQIQESCIGYANPKTVINTDYKNIQSASNIPVPKVVQNALKTVITLPKTCKNTSYKINPDLKPVEQNNTYAVPIPKQATLQNVVLIGSDIVYQPCAVQTPVRAVNFPQKTFVAYNNQPNMAIYQTTQFAAPVINPLIIGNAITVPMTVTSTNVKIAEPVKAGMSSKPKITTPINHVEKRIDVTLNKTVTNDMNDVRLESKTNSVDHPKDLTLKEKDKFDINFNKNCERKVLSEVQENHKLSFTEKIEPKTKIQTKIGFDVKKESKDQERLKMKRLAILNRNILHISDSQPIALSYAPIKKIIIIPNVIQETPAIVVTNIQDKLQLPFLNTKVVTHSGTTIDVEKSMTINNNGNCKENKGNASCPRILLRSSSKIDKKTIELINKNAVPRKSKVRLKQAIEGAIGTSDTPTNEVKKKRSVAKKQVPRKTLNRTIKTREETKNKVNKMQTKRNAKSKSLLNKPEQTLEPVIVNASVPKTQDPESSKEAKIMAPIESQVPSIEISEANPEIDNYEMNRSNYEMNRSNYEMNRSKSDNECSSPSILSNDDTILEKLFQAESIPLINESIISHEKSDAEASRDIAIKDIMDDVISTTDADKALTNADVVEEIESYVKRLEQEKQANKTIGLNCQDDVFSTKDHGENVLTRSEVNTTETPVILSDVPDILSDVPVTQTNSTTGKSKENLVQVNPEIICLDDDDAPIQTRSSHSLKINYIRNVDQKNGKSNSKSDIPQSVKDAIQIEDLSHLNTGDPLKKCVRIKLPSGRSFKATVHGQVNCDIDTLFADPALKSVLMSNISHRQRYTLNIKQVPTVNTQSNTITGSRIQQISLAKPTVGSDLETIDLLSDSDEENDTQYFNTEYGKYKVANMKNKLFTSHQTRFDKTCSVKLVREDIQKYLLMKSHNERNACDLPKIVLPTVQRETVTSINYDCITVVDEDQNKPENVQTSPTPITKNMVNECPIVEIDDSSNDLEISESVLNFSSSNEMNTITESKENEQSIEKLKAVDANSIEAVEIDETIHTEHKIELKNQILKDLGLNKLTDETTNAVEPTVPIIETREVSTVKAPVNNDSPIKTFKPPECFVNLTKCDNLVSQYENLKLLKHCFIKLVRCDEMSQTINPCTGLTTETNLTMDDVTNMPVGFEVMEAQPLSRCGSFSILADYGADDDDYLFNSQLSEDEEIACSSPVMAAYGMIASYKDIQINYEKQDESNGDKFCETEWFLTKDIPLHSNSSNGPDLNENNAEDAELSGVPTLITLTSLFFQQKSIADLQTPTKLSPLHQLKRKSVESNIINNKIQKTSEDPLQDTACATDIDKTDYLAEIIKANSKSQDIVNAGSKGLAKSQSNDDFQTEFKMYLKKLSSSQEYSGFATDEVSTINVESSKENSNEDISESGIGSSVTHEDDTQTVLDLNNYINQSHADAVNPDSISNVSTEINCDVFNKEKCKDDENPKIHLDIQTVRREETVYINQKMNCDIEPHPPEAAELTTVSVSETEINESSKINGESELDSINICRSNSENTCVSDAGYEVSDFTDVPAVSISQNVCDNIGDDLDRTSQQGSNHTLNLAECSNEICEINVGRHEKTQLEPIQIHEFCEKTDQLDNEMKITSKASCVNVCTSTGKITIGAENYTEVNKKGRDNICDYDVIHGIVVPSEITELPDFDINMTSEETTEVANVDIEIINDECKVNICDKDYILSEAIPSIVPEQSDVDMEITSEKCSDNVCTETDRTTEVTKVDTENINDKSIGSICDDDDKYKDVTPDIIDTNFMSEKCETAEVANVDTEIIKDKISDSISVNSENSDIHAESMPSQITEMPNDVIITSEACDVNIYTDDKITDGTDFYTEVNKYKMAAGVCYPGIIHEETISLKVTELQDNIKNMCEENSVNICTDVDKTTEDSDIDKEMNNEDGCDIICTDADKTVEDVVITDIIKHDHIDSICDIDNIQDVIEIDSTNVCEEPLNLKNINKVNTSKENSDNFTKTDKENKTIEEKREISTLVNDIGKINYSESEIVLNDTDKEELYDILLTDNELTDNDKGENDTVVKEDTSMLTEILKGQVLDYEYVLIDDDTKLSEKSIEDPDTEPNINVSKDENDDLIKKKNDKSKDFIDCKEDVVVDVGNDDPLVVIDVPKNVDIRDEIINRVATDVDGKRVALIPYQEIATNSCKSKAPRNSSGLLINGIQFKDETMETCFLFPVHSEVTLSNNNSTVNQMPEDVIKITQQLGEDGKIEEIEIKLNLPKITYSRKFTEDHYLERLFFDTKCKRIMKRKADMTEIKIHQKKYRKGKNIDYPKITIATMEDSAYSKEFKRLFDYCSSVKFSYSRPFHKEDIDVQKTLTEWPIQGTCVREIPETEKDEFLFSDTETVSTSFHDPTKQTLADEIVATYNESAYSSSDIAETNFNMGFGEGSGRVIQNLEDGCGLTFSAATLSDVKQIQPLLLSENYCNCKREHSINNFRTKDETVKLQQNMRCIQIKDKIRSYFKKTMNELSFDWIKEQDKNDDYYPDSTDLFDTSEFPYGLNSPDWIQPRPLEVVVNVVQVGQLPVSASAQNPVTCDPRVTQVSDASPSQCSAENSLNDDPQSVIKTEYTELTTADLSMPLAQEYVQHIQTIPGPPREAMSYSMGENYPLDTNVNPEIKIELEETSEIKEEVEEHYDNNEPPPLYERNMMNNIDYSYEGNPANAVPVPNSNTEMMYMEKQYAPEAFPHLKHQQHHEYQLQQQILDQQQQLLDQQQHQLQQQHLQQIEQQFQQQLQQEQENQLQQEMDEQEKQHIFQQQFQEQENQQRLQQQMQEQEKQDLLHHQLQEQEKHNLLQQQLQEQQHLQQLQEQEKQQNLKLQLQEQENQHKLQLQEQEKQHMQQQPQEQEQQQLLLKKHKQPMTQKQRKQQERLTRFQQQLQEQEKQRILNQEKQQQQQQRQMQEKQKLQQKFKERQRQEKQEKQKQQLQLKLQKHQLLQKQQLEEKKRQQQELQQKHQQQQLLQKQQQQLQKQQQLQLQKQQKQLLQQQKKEKLLLKQQQSQKQQKQKQKQLQQQQRQQQEQQPPKLQQQEQQPPKSQPQQQNGSPEKPDQIAHAMNAAGITPTADTTPTNRAHALVNILSQKLRQGAAGSAQSTSNTFQKTTSINAMALQQALAQILPPPLNHTNATENNQQTSNTQLTPQVLHIVQGKNAAGNQQITLVDNSQQSGLKNQNSTPVLHIVQNQAASNSPTNGTPASQANSFSGLSLVDGGLQQGNQLLHIVNTGTQKNSSAGQLLKRVNLLTNLGGGNEQKMVQFVCKSADGKAIQLNAPHQRSMVLRLQPIETPNLQPTQQKQVDPQDLSPTANVSNNVNGKDLANSAEIKSRSIYEENYAKFIQNSSPKTTSSEKGTSLPKFNQAFGKQVYQDDCQKNEIPNGNSHSPSNGESPDCQPNDNAINLEHISQISSPPLLLRKTSPPTSQSQPNLVQQLKQTIAPMNIQTMHGGVIYTRQIPVNIGSGQTINLITVPSTELDDSNTPKQQGEVKFVNQAEIEPSIIKIVPQTQSNSNSDSSTEENNTHVCVSNDNTHPTQTQPVLTQMRIKLPMLSKPPQMATGTRVVRPSFFQIQRNVISGANQPVYQQLVLTAAPQLGQQTIRLPQPQTSRPAKTPSESQSSAESMSSSTLEQLREFDLVLEQVKERSTVQPNANSNGSSSSSSSSSTNSAVTKLRKPSTDTTDAPASTSTTVAETSLPQPAPHTQHQVLYSIGNTQPLNVTYVNRKAATPTATTSSFVRSPDSSGITESSASSSSHSQIPHTVTSETSSTSSDPPPAQPKPTKSGSKSKSKPKASSNPPNTLKLNNTVTPKTSSQKPLEDEQTTQRILYILAEYKEQVENSPDKDKPAPRRRTNPPLNPGSSKRKKSSSGSRRGREMSPIHGDETCRTMGSEDSSCGTSQGDCNESCLDSHSPEDSPRKVVRKLTFENETSVQGAQPRPQPQRNVIVADGQTITVARTTTGKPTTAVIMPANYILPVSMVKGGQQIAIVTNRGPKLLTVGGGEGGTTNALLLQRLIGPAGLKPVITRPGVRHVRLPAAALHNLQAFNLAAAATSQGSDATMTGAGISNPPELVETSKNSSPWRERETQNVKPERGSSPDASEPWHLQSADQHDYSYEETVRADNMDRTVLDPIPDRYSPGMEAQRIFDKMFDVDSKKSYMVDSHDDSPRCGYDIDASDCDDKGYHQVVQKKDGHHRQHRLTHVSAAALRHKYAILEHELRLQKSLSEECEDLGVDSPSASELFPEAELLFAASPAHDHTQDNGHSNTPQPILSHSIPQPDLDDQIATDQLLPRCDLHDDRDLGIGLEDVGIVTVSEDGMQATIALDQEEFARSHPNTTFHSEPTDEGEVQPFTITGIKSRQITSTIYHANRGPGTVLMTASQTTVISQATAESSGIQNPVKYGDIDHMINSLPGANVSHQNNNINLSSVLVKDDGLTRFDSILNDNRELHLSNTASAIVHANTTQVIRRVCYDTDKREQETRFLMGETDGLITGADAKMMTEDSRDFGDVDDDGSSPEQHTDLFWESNSASERSESRRPLDFSSDSDKCCKSPSYDEANSTDSSGLGVRLRLDSVIKEARSASADGSSDDAPPLRVYPAKRSLTGKTRAADTPAHAHHAPAHAHHAPAHAHHAPAHAHHAHAHDPRRRASARSSARGLVKRGCHCCSGEPAPPRPKKPRQKKPITDFATTSN